MSDSFTPRASTLQRVQEMQQDIDSSNLKSEIARLKARLAERDRIDKEQLVYWEEMNDRFELRVRRRKNSAATVYKNGYWYTWDRSGVGGENSREGTFEKAKIEAAASAIAQGFI